MHLYRDPVSIVSWTFRFENRNKGYCSANVLWICGNNGLDRRQRQNGNRNAALTPDQQSSTCRILTNLTLYCTGIKAAVSDTCISDRHPQPLSTSDDRSPGSVLQWLEVSVLQPRAVGLWAALHLTWQAQCFMLGDCLVSRWRDNFGQNIRYTCVYIHRNHQPRQSNIYKAERMWMSFQQWNMMHRIIIFWVTTNGKIQYGTI